MRKEITKNNGFTLLEVIVAVTILGTGFAIVLGMFSGGLRSAAISNDYSRALFLAKKKMGEVDLKNNFSNAAGSFKEEEFKMYKWSIEFTPYHVSINPESKVLPVVLKEKITVSWANYKKEKKVELVTIKTTL